MAGLEESFWEEERDCKLLELGGEWIHKELLAGTLQPRVQRWLEMAGVGENVPPLPEQPAGEKQRIFAADAERTWVSPSHRASFEALLQACSTTVGDYHQGLGFVAAFFSIVLPSDKAVALVARMNEEERYVPGYWKTAPEAYVRDAFVYARLLAEHAPEVSAHLGKFGIVAESYASKWFVALCVHVLPFRALADYFEALFEHGYVFLFRFAMALMDMVGPRILECTTTQIDKVSKLVRLDRTLFPPEEDDVFVDLVKRAVNDYSETVTKEKVDALRKEEWDRLQERLRVARERDARLRKEAEEDEITFSDED